jgi:hypothetical protein
MSWLSAARPDLVSRYEELYERGAYARPEERKRIGRLVDGFSRSTDPRFSRRGQLGAQRVERERRAAEPRQRSLF